MKIIEYNILKQTLNKLWCKLIWIIMKFRSFCIFIQKQTKLVMKTLLEVLGIDEKQTAKHLMTTVTALYFKWIKLTSQCWPETSDIQISGVTNDWEVKTAWTEWLSERPVLCRKYDAEEMTTDCGRYKFWLGTSGHTHL